jgi:hypothetical protein
MTRSEARSGVEETCGTSGSAPRDSAKRHGASVPPKKSKRPALASKAPVLTEADRELLTLAEEVRKCSESARNLVLRPDTQAHVARFGSVEAFKRRERQRMRSMLRAWRGLRGESGAPYRDPRMLLTEAIVFYATVERGSLSAVGEAIQRQHAAIVAGIVAEHYPELTERLREPERIERIRAALASAATSAKRLPLKLIAATWDDIEARPRDPKRWGVDWAENRARLNPTRRT